MTEFQYSDDPTLGLGAERPGGFPDSGFPDVGGLGDVADDPYAVLLTNLRGFLDYLAAANPDDPTMNALGFDLAAWRDRLAASVVSEREQMFAHRYDLPARGQTMTPLFEVQAADPERVSGRVRFGRYFLGGNGAVHGGAIPLLFDEVFGRLVNGHRTPARTASLRTDYRAVTPVGVTLDVEVWLDRVEGRKRFARGVLRDGSQVCVEAEALFIELRPGQP